MFLVAVRLPPMIVSVHNHMNLQYFNSQYPHNIRNIKYNSSPYRSKHLIFSWATNRCSNCSRLNGIVSSYRLRPKIYYNSICKVYPIPVVVGFPVVLVFRIVRVMLIVCNYDHLRSWILCWDNNSSNLWLKQVLAVDNHHNNHSNHSNNNSINRHSNLYRSWLHLSQK